MYSTVCTAHIGLSEVENASFVGFSRQDKWQDASEKQNNYSSGLEQYDM